MFPLQRAKHENRAERNDSLMGGVEERQIKN